MADYEFSYTGPNMNAYFGTIKELQDNGYIFKGVATPTTNPGTTTEKCAYIASEAGTYTNFGNLAVTGLSVLTYNGTAWSATSLNLDIQQTTGQSTTSVMSQKAVTDAIGKSSNYESELVGNLEKANGYINGTKWKTSTSYYGGWISCAIYKGQKITITAGSIRTTGVAFFTRRIAANDTELSQYYATGWSSQVAIQPNQSATFVVPSDAEQLYVLEKGTDSQNATPSSILAFYNNLDNWSADYLRAPINIQLDTDDYEQGGINTLGAETDADARIRSRMIYVGGNFTKVTLNDPTYAFAMCVYDANKNFIGESYWWSTYEFMNVGYFRIVVKKANESAISMADLPDISIVSGASALEPMAKNNQEKDNSLQYIDYQRHGGTLTFTADDFEIGGINVAGYNDGISDTRARTKHYIDIFDCPTSVRFGDTAYSAYIFIYDKNKTLLGISGAWVNNFQVTEGRYIRFAVRKGNGSASFSVSSINMSLVYASVNVPTISPYMEVFKSIPSTEINEEFQSFCKVGNEFWIASGGSGDDPGSIPSGYIYRYDLSWNYIAKMQQTIAHFNSMSYDPTTDRLITGQMGVPSNIVYIFNNVSSWVTAHASTPITSADVEREIVISQISNRPNPVWAERNAEGHRDMIISGDLNSLFLKIKLGYGTTQLTYGTYTASASGVPNGTYDIIWNIPFTPPAIIYLIANKLQYPTAVCQGIDYYKGKIYVMSTATPTTIIELTPNGSSLDCRLIHQLWCDDSGSVISNCANEGIMCLDGKIYVGVSAIGVPSTITTYNNKILRFDL